MSAEIAKRGHASPGTRPDAATLPAEEAPAERHARDTAVPLPAYGSHASSRPGLLLDGGEDAVPHALRLVRGPETEERLGAAKTIDYREDPKWGDAVRAAAGGRGGDLAVEVGGAGTFDQSVKALRYGGTMSLLGILAGTQAATAPARARWARKPLPARPCASPR
jgi:Zinc-binding dehydrogenase